MKKLCGYFLLHLLAVIFLTGCGQAAAPAQAQAPTDPPSPTAKPTNAPTAIPTSPSAGIWDGTWFIWAGAAPFSEEFKFLKPEPTVFFFSGDQIKAEILVGGIVHMMTAKVSADGVSALGEWTSDGGRTGSAVMLISEDGQFFAGNLEETTVFCGSRKGNSKPNPCYTEIGRDWHGEWVTWLGPDETEAVFIMEQDGSTIGTMVYDFSGKVSQDGRTISGTLNEMGLASAVEAVLLDNQAQFRGNIGGVFPFCGARPGGPKPSPCMGP